MYTVAGGQQIFPFNCFYSKNGNADRLTFCLTGQFMTFFYKLKVLKLSSKFKTDDK